MMKITEKQMKIIKEQLLKIRKKVDELAYTQVTKKYRKLFKSNINESITTIGSLLEDIKINEKTEKEEE